MPKERVVDTESFERKAKQKHGEKYGYQQVDYKGSKIPVKIECRIHGIFEQQPSNHLSGYGCYECGRIRSAQSQYQSSTTKEFIANAVSVHGDKYRYDCVDYVGGHTKVTIICPHHGKFQQTPSHHLFGEGCSKCKGIVRRKTTEKFVSDAIKVHGNTYTYDHVEYVMSKDKVLITCRKHGDFSQTANDHLTGYGCRNCAREKLKQTYSKVAIEWLESEAKRRGIVIRHATNGGEKNIRLNGKDCYLDGFCEATNQAFEFHGSFWHAHPTYAAKRDARHPVYKHKTNEQVYQDTLKREANIRTAGYELIVMWEHDWNRIKHPVIQLKDELLEDESSEDFS